MADARFMSKMKGAANKLIGRFGTSCRVETTGGDEFSAKIAFTNGDKKDGDNTMVSDYDRQGFMTDTKIQPTSGDLVFVGDDCWSVVRSSEYTPSNGQNVCWKLDLKA